MLVHVPGHDFARNWLFLIEATSSHGPISPARMAELEELLERCPISRIYVSAFGDFKAFKRHIGEIAWETIVWIAAAPEHMIHFNGGRILGPAA